MFKLMVVVVFGLAFVPCHGAGPRIQINQAVGVVPGHVEKGGLALGLVVSHGDEGAALPDKALDRAQGGGGAFELEKDSQAPPPQAQVLCVSCKAPLSSANAPCCAQCGKKQIKRCISASCKAPLCADARCCAECGVRQELHFTALLNHCNN